MGCRRRARPQAQCHPDRGEAPETASTSARRTAIQGTHQVNDTTENTLPRAKRGFAAMKPEDQRRIASMGGRAAHASGHAHEFTTEEARIAGRKRHEKPGQPSASA